MALHKKLEDTTSVSEAPSKARQRRRTGRMLNSGKGVNQTTNSNTTQSRLLSLPAEIRNRIYRLVLGGNTIHVSVAAGTRSGRAADRKLAVTICKAVIPDADAATIIRHSKEATEVPRYTTRHADCSGYRSGDPDENRYSVALLQTCRQAHSEAALLPFQDNTFSFHCKADFLTLVKKLMPVQQRAILSLSLDYHRNFCSLASLKALKGLKEAIFFVEIIHDDNQWLIWERDALLSDAAASKFSSLASATYCIYSFKRGIVQRGPCPMTTDPNRFNRLSEELEAKLL